MRGMRWSFVAILSIGPSLACQESPPPGPARKAVQPAELVFEPPADGKLTSDQVEMYIEATKRSPRSDGELPAGADGEEPLEALTSQFQVEIEVAEQLGYDSGEYQWVLARVMDAQLPMGADLGELATRVNEASLEGLEKQRERVSDPAEQARLDQQISELKGRLEEAPPAPGDTAEDSARQHNRNLLERHLEE